MRLLVDAGALPTFIDADEPGTLCLAADRPRSAGNAESSGHAGDCRIDLFWFQVAWR